MKLSLSRRVKMAYCLMLSVALLQFLTVNICADSTLSADWYFRFSNTKSLSNSGLLGTYTKYTPDNPTLSSQRNAGTQYFTVGTNILSDVAADSQVYLSFRVDIGAAASAAFKDSPAPALYSANFTPSSTGSLSNMSSYSGDDVSLKRTVGTDSNGLSFAIFTINFPFDNQYSFYAVLNELNLPNGGMVLTTLVNPTVIGKGHSEAVETTLTDISEKISENTLSQQQGNAIMQSIADSINSTYVDQSDLDQVESDVSSHEAAESVVKDIASDIISQEIEVDGETYQLSADSAIFDTYKEAFSEILGGWDSYSLNAATYFRGTLIQFIGVFGLFIFFPCTLGLAGALLGRS